MSIEIPSLSSLYDFLVVLSNLGMISRNDLDDIYMSAYVKKYGNEMASLIKKN